MTERTLRQATRTYDGRDAAERIAHLEAEVKALRAEVVRLQDAVQRYEFVAAVEEEMERLHVSAGTPGGRRAADGA